MGFLTKGKPTAFKMAAQTRIIRKDEVGVTGVRKDISVSTFTILDFFSCGIVRFIAAQAEITASILRLFHHGPIDCSEQGETLDREMHLA